MGEKGLFDKAVEFMGLVEDQVENEVNQIIGRKKLKNKVAEMKTDFVEAKNEWKDKVTNTFDHLMNSKDE
ncbi:hypothetical protein AN639_07940 [Candidatus Epulonipiscium fishelsonii]|uniref:Uncharacterized protein n=1 Tax=Candidatus Epulonipiscium fishelsonii TaxID=77094 RepID=A0ACC8X7P5_9FIRM|nr:hypothetical protein AN396_12650 [Epulopiscium sp. SCG-B11WGA-EpuloA1]ONI38320.1 hypothetical protein AN639_07940 [Epulopiscium sp. SCG-B05WGA-EpuloA1]